MKLKHLVAELQRFDQELDVLYITKDEWDDESIDFVTHISDLCRVNTFVNTIYFGDV